MLMFISMSLIRIYWRPERIWSSKKGILNFLSKFSNQFRMRVKRKTGFLEANLFNPFDSRINDTNLIQTHSLIRNSVFFNRTSSIFASEYRFQVSKSKNLLATGFDGNQYPFMNSPQDGTLFLLFLGKFF